MITLKLKYSFENLQDKDLIHSYMNQYNHVFRVAFNKFQSNNRTSVKLISSELNNIELLDSWFIASALNEAKALYNLNPTSKVIFGGRKNFIQRMKNQISKEQFNLNRLSPLCSVGEKKSGTKSVHGNRKFKLSSDLSFITLKLKEKKIKLNLKSYHKNIKKQLVEIYKHQLLDDIAITYKVDLEYVYITFDETILTSNKFNKQFNPIENRILSIDLNPNYIGYSIVDWKSSNEFKVITSGVYSIKELNDKDFELKGKGFNSSSKERIYLSNKRQHEILEISKNLINKAIYYKCSVFSIEDLSIKSSDKENGKHFNKLVNNFWCRNLLVNNLTKRCNIFKIKLLKVKPEYSSFIGNFLFRNLNLPDMVLSSIEISRRAYEFYNQYVIKTKNTKKNIIQPLVSDFKDLIIKSLEEFNINEKFESLIDLYYFFKKSKLMYRLSLDKFNLKFFRSNSLKSNISVCYF